MLNAFAATFVSGREWLSASQQGGEKGKGKGWNEPRQGTPDWTDTNVDYGGWTGGWNEPRQGMWLHYLPRPCEVCGLRAGATCTQWTKSALGEYARFSDANIKAMGLNKCKISCDPPPPALLICGAAHTRDQSCCDAGAADILRATAPAYKEGRGPTDGTMGAFEKGGAFL